MIQHNEYLNSNKRFLILWDTMGTGTVEMLDIPSKTTAEPLKMPSKIRYSINQFNQTIKLIKI